MSKRANPTAIGLFMIGALALGVAGVAVLASTTLFQERDPFISYFPESVNGLEVGAPVKFKGVPVGSVKELRIRIDLDEKTFQVPVVYIIDLERLTSEAGTYVDLSDEDVLQEQILNGLRAQLQMESFVTGQLYIELTYVSDPSPDGVAVVAEAPYPVIPTQPSLLATLGGEAGSLVSELQSFDLRALNRNIMSLLVTANEKLERLDVEGLNTSLMAAARSVEDVASSTEVQLALRELPGATARFGETMAEVQLLVRRLDESVAPLQEQLGGTNEEIVVTLQALRAAIADSQRLLSRDAGLGYHAEEALESLSEMADAIRTLARSLEQNPSALIRGRTQPDEQP